MQLSSRGAILNDPMFRTNTSADYIAKAAKVRPPAPPTHTHTPETLARPADDTDMTYAWQSQLARR